MKILLVPILMSLALLFGCEGTEDKPATSQQQEQKQPAPATNATPAPTTNASPAPAPADPAK